MLMDGEIQRLAQQALLQGRRNELIGLVTDFPLKPRASAVGPTSANVSGVKKAAPTHNVVIAPVRS